MIPSFNPASNTNRLPSNPMPPTVPARGLSASCPNLANRFHSSSAGQSLAMRTQSDLPAREEREQWNYSDCHFHPTNYIQQGYRPESLIAEMDALGIKYATLMPIPTNVLSSQPDPAWDPCKGQQHCGPHYYLPSHMMNNRSLTKSDMAKACAATELYVNTGVDATTAIYYQRLTAAERQRFDPMITGLHLGDMHSSTYLLEKLNLHPGVFTGVGEITVHKEVVQDLFAGRRQANLDSNAGALVKLLQTCGTIGMPVVLHCDVDLPGQENNASPVYLEGIRRLFCDPCVSQTNIIWAHGGGLGRFVNAPAGHTATLRQLLEDSRMKHVHIDLSWSVVAERLTQSPETQAEWVSLITDHSERFLFGSDALAPKDRDAWNKTYASYNGLLMSLTDAVRLKLLHGNYQRLFVDARERVRAYEKFFLAAALRDAASPSSLTAGVPTTTATTTTITTTTTGTSGATATTTTASARLRRDHDAEETQATPGEAPLSMSVQPHGSPGALRH